MSSAPIDAMAAQAREELGFGSSERWIPPRLRYHAETVLCLGFSGAKMNAVYLGLIS